MKLQLIILPESDIVVLNKGRFGIFELRNRVTKLRYAK